MINVKEKYELLQTFTTQETVLLQYASSEADQSNLPIAEALKILQDSQGLAIMIGSPDELKLMIKSIISQLDHYCSNDSIAIH